MALETETTLELKVKKKRSAPFSKPITWEQFKNRYLWREDGYKYEWINGYVERTKRFENYKKWLQLGRKSSLNDNID